MIFKLITQKKLRENLKDINIEETSFSLNFKNKREIKSKIDKIKEEWDKKEKFILNEIEKITKIKIDTKNIFCYLDPYTNLGFYGKKDISVSLKLDLETTLMVITHELFHIFYWKKIKELGLLKKINEEKEWKISEVVVFFLLNEKSLNKFWPNTKVYLYPEIKDYKNKLSRLWKKESFDNFLIKSYEKSKNKAI